MGEKIRPVVLLTEIDDSVGLDAHAETRPNRDIFLKGCLSGWPRCSVFATGSENDESKSTSRKEPVTLHNFSSGGEPACGGRGRKQAAYNICYHPKARHPRVRMALPCSSSFGGGNLTDPGTLGGAPVRGFAAVPWS